MQRMPCARIPAILLLLSLLPACSLSWLYDHADWLIVRATDGYVDLTPPQKEWLYGEVREHLGWHRREALPAYARVLADARGKLADGLTMEEVRDIEASVRRQATVLTERLLPDAAALLGRLSPEQVDHLARELAEERVRQKAELDQPTGERLAKRTNAMVELVEEWVGPLEDGQRASLEEMSRALPSEGAALAAEKAARQDALVARLREGRTAGLEKQLHAWLVDDPTAPSQSWRDGARRMVLALDASLTAAQRRVLLGRLDRLVTEIRRTHLAR